MIRNTDRIKIIQTGEGSLDNYLEITCQLKHIQIRSFEILDNFRFYYISNTKFSVALRTTLISWKET